MSRGQEIKRVFVAGASGQVGRELTRQLVAAGYKVRALVHKTPLDANGVECVQGSVSDLDLVCKAVKGADAICQLATTKEDPETFLDVSVRGTYNLLEAARRLGTIRRWILSGGDAAMGIYYYPQPAPISENMPHRAYPGCYALSKVLEEVLGQQYHVQYGLPYVCLRASWIQHEDMILRHFSARRYLGKMTPAQRKSLKDPSTADSEPRGGQDRIAVLVGPDGRLLLRHVVGLPDVVSAFLLALEKPASVGQTFNIAAPSAFAYDVAGEYLSARTGLPTMRIKVPEAHDFAIDISKARAVLGYQPRYDIFKIIDAALEYRAGAAP